MYCIIVYGDGNDIISSPSSLYIVLLDGCTSLWIVNFFSIGDTTQSSAVVCFSMSFVVVAITVCC